MYPQIGSWPSYPIGWGIAALLSAISLWRLYRRANYPLAVLFIGFSGLAIALLLGSKAAAIAEIWLQPENPTRGWVSLIRSPEFRIPGGIVAALAAGPLMARALRVPYLTFADHTVPAAGVCLVGIRIGCFLQGCCFGRPSNLPWSISFPRYSEAFGWQLNHGLVSATATASEPIHPLQLYFAAVGIAMAIFLWWRLKRRRFPGEVLLFFVFVYFWSTWLLEQMRASPHALVTAAVFVLALASTAALLTVEIGRFIFSAAPR